ncbi:hypothetical protein CK203_049827 [Vitis vinifera]|uniref:Uncharacterized protein n=1 Tax=Vitis vinifera TaxID=29760 RepID=A0A438GVT3_VITVI|nr:hypothetical protein CK203_049827 [Vitis vinifera]
MGKDSSPTSSHFPVTRRYSSSMTHHILEKVWYESSQAHKCGEKGPDDHLVFQGTSATPVSSPPPKRTRISGPGESSRTPPSPPASTIPGPSHLTEVLKRPMIAGPPLPGNTDIRDRPFHDEICMEHETLRLLPELEESYRLLQRYHIEPFMTPGPSITLG